MLIFARCRAFEHSRAHTPTKTPTFAAKTHPLIPAQHLFRRRGFLVVLVATTAVALGLFAWWKNRPYDPLEAVSEQSAIALYASAGLRGWEGLVAARPPVQQLRLVEQCRAEVASLSQVLSPHAVQWWLYRPQVAAFSLLPNDSLHPLLAVDMGVTAPLEQVLADAAAWTAHRFRTYEIYEYRGQDTWVVALCRNMLLASRFSYAIEEALVQLERRADWWVDQRALMRAPLVAIARPEILFERVQDWLPPLWQGVWAAAAASTEAVGLGFWPDSTEVAVRVSTPIPSTKALPRSGLAAVLPDHVAGYSWLVRSPPEKAIETLASPRAEVDAFRQYVLPWCGQEAALVWLEAQPGGSGVEMAWVCSVTDAALAQRYLTDYGTRTGWVRRYQYQAFEIHQFLNPTLLKPLFFSGTEAHFTNPACVLLEGYAVFASSAACLELWLSKYIANLTLSNETDYLLLMSRQRKEGTWAIFARGPSLPALVRKMLKPGLSAALAGEMRAIAAGGLLDLDFQPERRGVWRAILLQQEVSRSLAVRLMWKSSLPAPIAGAPQWIAPSEAEPTPLLFVQDALNQLHCMEAGGRLRWAKALGQPLRSRISVLEGLWGGQRYYAFNTAEALWMLDAQGREVLGFPLRLQWPANNGLLAVPFESARHYGLFVACANGNLYGFDVYGHPLPGWNPKTNVGLVPHPLLHFTHANQDYLIALSIDGHLTCSDRLGNPHFAALQLAGAFTGNPPACIYIGRQPHILCVNDAGRAFLCHLNGRVQEYALAEAPSSRALAAALSTPDVKTPPAIAVVSGDRMTIAHFSAGPQLHLNRSRLSISVDTLWAVDESHFGALCRPRRQILLLNRSGNTAKGFPVGGTTPFSLFTTADEERWLVVGYDREIYAYLWQAP